MLGALIIVFREVIEAGLVIGIVLAATRGVQGRGKFVTLGCVAGILGAAITAVFAGQISGAVEGSGQELFNAGVLGSAVVMLTWHNVWMARHGRDIAAEMVRVGAAVTARQRPPLALAIVVGVAVLREGAEVVLFLYGIIASGTNMADLLIGAALGVTAGIALSTLTYAGLVSISPRHIFSVTGALIALLAAGMAAQAVQFLDAAGWIGSGGTPIWDSSHWLPENSLLGRLLRTLIGYTERPTEFQLTAYATTLAMMALLMRIARQSASGPLVSSR